MSTRKWQEPWKEIEECGYCDVFDAHGDIVLSLCDVELAKRLVRWSKTHGRLYNALMILISQLKSDKKESSRGYCFDKELNALQDLLAEAHDPEFDKNRKDENKDYIRILKAIQAEIATVITAMEGVWTKKEIK